MEQQDIQWESEECVICMNKLRVDVDSNGHVNDHNSTFAKYYMQTPCNHKYHIQCLKKWMDIRMDCPSCRQPIPPLDDD